jgi:hypothetical protein
MAVHVESPKVLRPIVIPLVLFGALR